MTKEQEQKLQDFDTFLLEKIHKLQYDTLSENEIKKINTILFQKMKERKKN